MDIKTKQLDFNGQTFFIGIDTHKNNWKITVRSNGLTLKTFSMNPSPKELFSYLHKNYPGGRYFSAYEAGYSGFWIHRELNDLGIRNIVVNAADIPGTNKEKDRKDDNVDSSKISRELNNGSLKGIHIPDQNQESIRIISRKLQQYTRRITQVKCRIKALLSFLGMDSQIETNQRWSAAHLRALSNLKFTQTHNRIALDIDLEELEHLRKMRLKLLKEIRKFSSENQIISLLRTIPGIGIITAFTLYTELMGMERFNSLDQLASIIGLVPSTSSSDSKTVMKGLSQRHSRFLRYALIESAWVAVRVDPVFTHCYNRLCHRMSKQRAIIRIAKKLLNRIRHVWKNKQRFVIGTIETAPVSKDVLNCTSKDKMNVVAA
jgi:transposase